MNPREIFKSFAHYAVDYLVLGGVNFMVAHQPILTFDVDIWINDNSSNRLQTSRALVSLGAAWGRTEEAWQLVSEDSTWLLEQPLYCLTSREGAIDIFREVRGLEGRWSECRSAAILRKYDGIEFLGLSDLHMLDCQLALDLSEQKADRIRILKETLQHHRGE